MDHPAETASVVAGNSSFQVSPFFDQVNKYKKKKEKQKRKRRRKRKRWRIKPQRRDRISVALRSNNF